MPHSWKLLLALALAPRIAIAQRPTAVIAGGVHVQSVGGTSAGGVVVEAGVNLYVAPMIAVRPELAWVSAPSQGAPPVFATSSLRSTGGGAGGHPQLFFAGGSLVIARTSIDSARVYALAGGSIAHGRGNGNWSATRPAFAPHIGIGWRPFVTRPRFVIEARGRYAPIWYNDPLQFFGVVAGWVF